MPLYELEDYYPNYRATFGDHDVKALDLYTEGGERIGAVDIVLVDDDGRFRYLGINTDSNGDSKKILLPIGLSHIDYNAGRVYVDGLSKQQVERFPVYQLVQEVDFDYEDELRRIFRPTSGLEETYDRDNYDYDLDPDLYSMNEQDHEPFYFYQERLIVTRPMNSQ
jgi:PRC-barrel domain